MAELQLLDELGATASEPQMVEARAAEVAHRVSVIAAVSKGYQSLESPVARAAFTRTLQLTLAALGPYGASAEVRGRSVTLLHRMVETFSIDVLSYLTPALPHLLHPADPKETADVTALVVQMIQKFKSAIAHSVSPVVAPLTAAIFRHVDRLEKAMAAEATGGGANTPLSEEGRERRALLRSYFTFLHALVTTDLTPVLSDVNNFPRLDTALTRLLQGCVEGPDLTVQRQCILVVQKLVEHLAGKYDSFDDYIRASILPASFAALMQPHFSLRDAAALALLEAVATLQVSMLAKLGPAFLSHLHDVYLPSINVPAEFNDEYARLLTLGDPRQLRDFLRQRMDLAKS
jgi:exportin-T